MSISMGTTTSEIAQAALDAAEGQQSEKRKPITNAEAKAVLDRFRLIDLLNLVVHAARASSDKMSMTAESTAPGVRVVVRVTHPRVKKGSGLAKKGSGLGARGSGEKSGA